MWASRAEITERVEANREARREAQRWEAESEAQAIEVLAKPASEPPPPHPPPVRIRKRRGRPPNRPWWLPLVAEWVAQGLTLRKALRRYGVVLSQSERRNVYRWKDFRALVDCYRAKR